jgi:methyl-accepting chemotaxis protein
MGAIVLGGLFVATSRMAQIDEGYSKFLETDVRAAIDMARFSRNTALVQASAYRLLAETSLDGIDETAAEINKTFDEMSKLADAVQREMPTFRARVDELRSQTSTVRQALEPVLNLVQAGESPKAMDMLRDQVTPAIVKLSQQGLAIRNSVVKDVEAGSRQLTESTWSTVLLTRVLMGGGLVAGIGLAILVAIFGITRPIHRLVSCMRILAEDRFDTVVPGAERGDELGVMAGAVEVFRTNGLEVERMRAEQTRQVERAAEMRKTEMGRLADGFEAAIGGIVGSVSTASGQLESAAATLTRTAATTQELSGVVAGASEGASGNVQSAALATEQMTSSVNEIARQVQESSRIAGEAVRQAQSTDARIAELSQAASRIGDVVKLITAIAEQTNLLALNATIEAARAGEAGRGFAVVAQEVKALAAQTARATDEIGTQIAGMQRATQDSVAAIKEIGATIGHISGIAATITAAVEQQGAATAEIARNVHQAAHGTTNVAASIGDVNTGAADTSSASAQILASARALSSEGAKLKTEVEKFLASVRVA